ncbi:MAG: arginyltransferase, partial [Pseudomonadota bacterium]
MRHTLPLAPQFYVTAPQPCPYLADRMERKLFTSLQGDNAELLNDSLSKQGFRRSQNVLYRPACADCAACLSARVPVTDFKFSKNQKRILRRNESLVRKANAPWATEEQFDLFRRYLDVRHANGGMADMDIFEFAAMVEETPVRSRVIEYHDADQDDALTAVALT